MTIEDALFPLYILALPLIVLYFLRDEIFHSWARFILVWAPLSVILTVLNGPYSSIVSPGSEGAARILAGITVMMSLSIFVLKSWDLRRADKGNPLAWWIKWISLVFAFAFSLAISVYVYGLIW